MASLVDDPVVQAEYSAGRGRIEDHEGAPRMAADDLDSCDVRPSGGAAEKFGTRLSDVRQQAWRGLWLVQTIRAGNAAGAGGMCSLSNETIRLPVI